mmetsp:Transcript_19425/g.40981  ORF Transcript_19425/g.40981 Transcript_19425/m.40981 type:complete len:240 (-) Transcript_19425:181-900(-)
MQNHWQILHRQNTTLSKKRTGEHISDVWKVISTGRAKYGENWFGSGGYALADSFAKHFAASCRDCRNHKEARARMKEIMTPTIIWQQGNRIRCMKTSRTIQCKICMMERKEILHRFRTDKTKIINDNSDIFSSCKCGSAFHKFIRKITTTLRTRSTQKKVNSTRQSKPNRSRFSFSESFPPTPTTNNIQCQPCSTSTAGSTSTSLTEEPASLTETPVFYHSIPIHLTYLPEAPAATQPT